MRGFPQELVDLVIDKLADSFPSEASRRRHGISNYSTVSRKWIRRTQQLHFELLLFIYQGDLNKWRTVFTGGPPGVSRNVRTLFWVGIDSLEGFDGHVRAFTSVKEAKFYQCNILRSIDCVRPLESLGSSLVDLEIQGDAPPEVVVWLLKSLPHLHRFHATNIMTDPYYIPAAPLPRIPFFEDANDFGLYLADGYMSNALGWIPPTARFSRLAIGASCVRDQPGILNKWIASSCECLKYLYFSCDGYLDESGFTIGSVDLSSCISLETLKLPVLLTDPGVIGDIVLPSVTSPDLSEVVLDLCPNLEEVDPKCWKTLESHLCRLAKQFKTTHEGREMVVKIEILRNGPLFAKFRNKPPMPDLDEDAMVVLSHVSTWDRL